MKKTVPASWTAANIVTKTVIIDSRQRDCKRFKDPAEYRIALNEVYKNVVSIELKGAIVPKTCYNVHSGNNAIDFSVGDSVTGFRILNPGSGFTSAPQVFITGPTGQGGTNATAVAYINSRGEISNVQITSAGSGYSASMRPIISVEKSPGSQPVIECVVGTVYSAILRPGEYEIGGNPDLPGNLPSKLLLEIQNSMNYAMTGIYNPVSTGPFVARLVSQYPAIGAEPGTPESFGTNACEFNRVQVTNVLGSVWEFLWNTGPNSGQSASGILGFNTVDTGPGTLTQAVVAGLGTLVPAGTSIRGTHDFNLQNDPDYVVLTISANEKNLDRIKGQDETVDQRFCTLLFDNNCPDTLHDLSGKSVEVIDDVRHLVGDLSKGKFHRAPGLVKPIKANDFDGAKKIVFNPMLGRLSTIYISFTKYGKVQGSKPRLYSMEGREHLLMFEIITDLNIEVQLS